MRACGYVDEDQLLDELRYSDSAFQLSGSGTAKQPDGSIASYRSGVLEDAVGQSITLRQKIEAGSVPRPMVGGLPRMTISRIESERTAFASNQRQKHEQSGVPAGSGATAQIASEIAVWEFETAARECRSFCRSADEFALQLRFGIAHFARFHASTYEWLSSEMRQEILIGFELFLTQGTMAAQSESGQIWPGYITGTALSNTAKQLVADLTDAPPAPAPESDSLKATSEKPESKDDQLAVPGPLSPACERAVDMTDAPPALAPETSSFITQRVRRGAPRKKPDLHPEVQDFLDDIERKKLVKVTFTNFAIVTGYRDDTVLGWWRVGHPRSTSGHASKFQNTLKMTPEEFLEALKKSH
jgi:hypothetical protein